MKLPPGEFQHIPDFLPGPNQGVFYKYKKSRRIILGYPAQGSRLINLFWSTFPPENSNAQCVGTDFSRGVCFALLCFRRGAPPLPSPAHRPLPSPTVLRAAAHFIGGSFHWRRCALCVCFVCVIVCSALCVSALRVCHCVSALCVLCVCSFLSLLIAHCSLLIH